MTSNELLANCVIYSTACDLTDAANQIDAEGQPVDPDDLDGRGHNMSSIRMGRWCTRRPVA